VRRISSLVRTWFMTRVETINERSIVRDLWRYQQPNKQSDSITAGWWGGSSVRVRACERERGSKRMCHRAPLPRKQPSSLSRQTQTPTQPRLQL